MCPSAVLPMGQHLTVPLVTIPLTIPPLDGEDRPAMETTLETTLEDRRSTKTLSASECPCQRPQRHARRFREKTLHCEGQAQVRARRSAPPCHPTADLEPDETAQRDHEMDLHHLRQTEYRAFLHFHYSDYTSCLSPPPNDPMQVDVPRERTP